MKKYTASQLHEAGMSRRDFLKFMGKVAGAAAAPPESLIKGAEQLVNLRGRTQSRTRAVIDVFPREEDSLSGTLGAISGFFNMFKTLMGGDIYGDYEFGDYRMFKLGDVDLASLVKTFGLEKFIGGGESYNSDTGQYEKIGFEGIWGAKTPFGNIQVIDLDTYGEDRYEEYGNMNIGGLSPIINPIKNFWDAAGKDMINRYNFSYEYPDDGSIRQVKHHEDFFDEDGLHKLEEAGIDSDRVMRQREVVNRRHDSDTLRQENGRQEWEEEQRKKKEANNMGMADREYGAQGQPFGPQSPRPAQALGPFEGKLKGAGLVESDRNSRSLERSAFSGDPDDLESYLRAKAREGIDPPRPDVQGNPIKPQVDKLLGHSDRPGMSYGSPSDWSTGYMEQIVGMEHRPLGEYDYYAPCSECGGDVSEDFGMIGSPEPDEWRTDPLSWDRHVSGVVTLCDGCSHRVFYRPKVWPPKGYRNKAGEWVWLSSGTPSPFESRLKNRLLGEADGMSRRKFLKTLVGGAAAAYGAPLGNLADAGGALGKAALSSASPMRMVSAWTGTHYGRGTPPSLTHCIKSVLAAYQRASKLSGTNEIRSFGDEDWGFTTEVSEDVLKKIAEEAGTTIDDYKFWWEKFDLDVGGAGEEADVRGYLGRLVSNPVKQWVEEFAGYDMDGLIQSSADIKEFENRGLEDDIHPEEMDKVRDKVEQVRKIEARDSVKELTPSDFVGRESGYESRGPLDPRSSRPVAGLGPFEERLMGKLLGESDEESRRAQRNAAAENDGEQIHHLARRRREGIMSKQERRAVQLAVFLGYEPAMVLGIPAPPEWTPMSAMDRPEVRIRLALSKSDKILPQPKFANFIWLCLETAIGRTDFGEESNEIFYEIIREARAGKISLETQTKLVEAIKTNPEDGEGYPARARHALVASTMNTVLSALKTTSHRTFAISMTMDLFQDENDHNWVADQLAQYLLGLA